LEVGEVLAATRRSDQAADGDVIRKLTVEDELLLARLDKHRDEAFQACRQLIRERNLPATLLDVEHLFDGRSLYFYFLGNVTPEVEELTDELAATYEAKVQFNQFVDTLTAGCGPGCGTEEATGQGCLTGGCATCVVAQACDARGSGA